MLGMWVWFSQKLIPQIAAISKFAKYTPLENYPLYDIASTHPTMRSILLVIDMYMYRYIPYNTYFKDLIFCKQVFFDILLK